MSNVTLPQAGVAATGMGGVMTRDWYRWAHDVTQRIGGVTGESISDLVLSQFEDAGIEESKAQIYALRDEIRAFQSLLSEVRDTLAEVRKEMAGIQSGQVL